MTRFVAIKTTRPHGSDINTKYVKQTYDAMSDNRINLELVAMQISQLPVREQHKFFRLLINYIEATASKSTMQHPPVGLDMAIELCNRLMSVVNDYYFEQDEKQMALEGM